MYFKYSGLNIYYEKKGTGTPIIFLHGWGCTGDIFTNITKDLINVKCFFEKIASFFVFVLKSCCMHSVVNNMHKYISYDRILRFDSLILC